MNRMKEESVSKVVREREERGKDACRMRKRRNRCWSYRKAR